MTAYQFQVIVANVLDIHKESKMWKPAELRKIAEFTLNVSDEDLASALKGYKLVKVEEEPKAETP